MIFKKNSSLHFVLAIIFIFILPVILNPIYEDDEDSSEQYIIIEENFEDSTEEEGPVEDIEVALDGGFIQSPGYPHNYEKSANYSWLLSAPPDGRLRLLVRDLKTEANSECTLDYVNIFDGNNIFTPLLARLCDLHANEVYVSSGRYMLIQLVTDDTYEDKGFEMDYFLETGEQCNITISESEGLVTSPDFPNLYADKTDCWSLIKLENSRDQIMAVFSHLEMEYDPDCSYDYVELLDGVSNDSPFLGRYCGQEDINRHIVSSEGALMVHFHSDDLVQSKGFALSYSTIGEFTPTPNPEVGACMWEMDKLNGTISSPNYPQLYEPNDECLFYLEAPENKMISLTIETIEMDEHENCKFDYVLVRDGHFPDSRILGNFCGRVIDHGQVVTSSSNKMTVLFHTDSSIEFRGFKASYKVVKSAPIDPLEDAVCENLIF